MNNSVKFALLVVVSLVVCSNPIAQLKGIQSEQLLPKDAVTVFSINNISLLQKIAMDDLVNYEFMSEVHQELFDGSTSGKTLKDAGLDFNQRLNLFYGKTFTHELTGFTFGVSDQKALFEVFDDFQELQSTIPGLKIYGTFFNHLLIKNNNAILIRIEPTMDYIDEVTDSIWYARGNETPFEFFDSAPQDDQILNEQTFEDDTNTNFYPEASENPSIKNYYELRDSVQAVLQQEELTRVIDELFVDNINLHNTDARFAAQLTHNAEGVFYLDNARNLDKSQGLWYFQTFLPNLYKDLQELYAGNVILGDLFLRDNQIDFEVEALYGPSLGSIYAQMNDARFDSNVLKYIPASSPAYFTYNINLEQAYEQAYQILLPLLSDEKNAQIAMNVLTLELLNEFIDKEALFDTYKGSMFGAFNGVKKIKTKKVVFSYDEETFAYQEQETEADADMPIFTLGFSTARADIPEMVLKHLARLSSRVQHFENYWRINNAILDAAPLYILNTGKLLIFTNDEELARLHSSGYGNLALTKKQSKLARKSGSMYGSVDITKTLDRFPTEVLTPRNAEIVNSLKRKSGHLELTSSETTEAHTTFKLSYRFESDESTGKHLLDLVNSLYLIYTLNP
ncbi:MAG: hypothetical protein LW839_06845 [Cryomorphaceae bacterium]|nr:hypothetical protein [Cryomorphaceae bacterium]